MNYKRIFYIALLSFTLQFFWHIEETKANELKTVVIYMTPENIPTKSVYLWEATFSAFSKETTLFSADEIEGEKLKEYDLVVFIGEKKERISESLRHALEHFQGKIVVFGHNASQLSIFADWKFEGEAQLRKLDKETLPMTYAIEHVIPPAGSEVLSVGSTLNEEVPFVIRHGNIAYIAAAGTAQQLKFAVSRSIYDVLDLPIPTTSPAYIQITDISPVSDPNGLREIGDYLIAHHIPFYLSVTPVYIDPATGNQAQLKEHEALVQVLLNLQAHGGVIVANGYSQQYYMDGAYEGIEFWDAMHNQKITSSQGDSETVELKPSTAFASWDSYATYLNTIDEIEKTYIERKHTMAIEELVENGLYPLAFEAPHDAMSITGYQVTANYFSALFGQLQLSNDQQAIDAPLFLSTPEIASHMAFFPNTIGTVDGELENPFEKVSLHVERLKTVPGAVIGGRYSVRLGVENLQEMIQLIESVGPIQWVDLRETTQFVQTNHITILQKPGESIAVSSTLSRVDAIVKRIKGNPFEASLWFMAIIVIVFIIAFFIYISLLRIRLRKRLFEEREISG